MPPRVLVVDNYDSFVFTLVDYLRQLGAATLVVRNDAPSLVAWVGDGGHAAAPNGEAENSWSAGDDVDGVVARGLSVGDGGLSAGDGGLSAGDGVESFAVDGVLVSPGPGAPSQAGQSLAVIRTCAERGIPMLGVCLGHQALGEVFGATVAHAPELRHGKTSPITHDGTGVFAGLPNPLTATRYHSLAVVPGTVPPCLHINAQSADVIMGLTHRTKPLHGVQFHPESFLTTHGLNILANWLALINPKQPVCASEKPQGPRSAAGTTRTPSGRL